MPPEVGRPCILFVASGPASVALTVTNLIETRFPEHRVDLVVSEPLLERLTPAQCRRVVFVAGRDAGRLKFLTMARQEPYWMVAVLLAGQPGYFTMKVAGLLLGLGRVIVCYTENTQAFALDRRHGSIILAHVANRLGRRRSFIVRRPLLRGLHTLVGEPLGLCWMISSIGVGRFHGWLKGRRRNDLDSANTSGSEIERCADGFLVGDAR